MGYSEHDDLRALALRWHAEGRHAAVVTVTAARGSVPREAGTRMLVGLDEVHATIGGGHLEMRAIADARALIASDGVPLQQTVALGPSLGQCCGGVVELRIARLLDEPPAAWPEATPLFHLQLYGAGHVGRAVARLLAGIRCRVQWVDERESAFPHDALPPHIERVCVEPVEAEVAAAPPGAFYLVLTHSHALDLAITRAIVARGDFAYFGLIGSATKRAKFAARLRERGVANTMIERITCPIGVAGMPGKEPEVIAVAVVAQLLQQAALHPLR
jgi:xanthine dehydrogenase accessory factor